VTAPVGLGLAVGAVFASGGVLKLAGRGPAMAMSERLGLSRGLLGFIGVCELAGGLGVLLGVAAWLPVAAAAAAGLTLLTLSGAAAHARAREPFSAWLPALVLCAACGVLTWSLHEAGTHAPGPRCTSQQALNPLTCRSR
jgi:putative oxidoreductase